MISTVTTVRILQAVAMTVGIAVFLWSTGLPTIFRSAEAASITLASDTMTNSAPSALSDHTIDFTTENGLIIGQTILITFETGFVLDPAFGAADMDLELGAADQTLANGAAGAGQWGVATTSTTVQLTTPTDAGVASSTAVHIYLGQVGPNTVGTENQITSPTATTSYYIDIDGTMQDSGQVRVAIIDEVTVSASVDTSLTFSVGAVGNGSTVNGTTTTGTSTLNSLPFGTLGVNEIETLAHDLTVATNAKNGYSVTVAVSGSLLSSTGATIDSFVDGQDTALPQAWTGPTPSIGNLDTYGHWGITSEDTVTARSNEFSSNFWVGIATTSPTIVMGHTGPADGITTGIGTTTVGYQIEISALQEAGDDYETELRYIATPTF